MTIMPIETRYRTEMNALFDEDERLRSWMRVEIALARAHAAIGTIPKAAVAEIEQAAPKVKLARVQEIEAEIHHDLMAMVKAMSEQCKRYGGYVHYGATSYDIEDTAMALTLRQAGQLLRTRTVALRKVVRALALDKAGLVCVGRTHGQHAVPTTYGMKFAYYYDMLGRDKARLDAAIERLSAGKMSGATGTMATFGPHAFDIERRVMDELGIAPAPITTQVIARDRHAELVFAAASLATTLEMIAKEIRNLQRTEIGEIAEPFASKQVGSSTMPHKRNPHKSERICSLARLVRAQVALALENIPLEHERDLTNSANERSLFPQALITTDYMLKETTKILSGLQFFPAQIERNLALTQGGILAERVMISLTAAGMSRQDAHELMRTSSREAVATHRSLYEIVSKDPQVRKLIKPEALADLFDPHTYAGQSVAIVKRTVAPDP